MQSSTLNLQRRFGAGFTRDPSATSIESPFNRPLTTSSLLPYTLTGMEIFMPDDRDYSRAKDIEGEAPVDRPALLGQAGSTNDSLLQFLLVVLLALYVSKRL